MADETQTRLHRVKWHMKMQSLIGFHTFTLILYSLFVSCVCAVCAWRYAECRHHTRSRICSSAAAAAAAEIFFESMLLNCFSRTTRTRSRYSLALFFIMFTNPKLFALLLLLLLFIFFLFLLHFVAHRRCWYSR